MRAEAATANLGDDRGAGPDAADGLLHEQPRVVREDGGGTLPRTMGGRAVFQGTQADVPAPRLRRVQRERGQVADLDGAPGPSPAAIPQVPREVEAELQPPRRCRARKRLGAPQSRPAPRNVWDGRWVEIGRVQAQAPVSAGVSALHDVSRGIASRQNPGISGIRP